MNDLGLFDAPPYKHRTFDFCSFSQKWLDTSTDEEMIKHVNYVK